MLFFFKQKTAYELRISDWSSDVCSSDLDEISRRIQNRRAKRADYVREISSSFRTVFFFGLTGLTTVLMVEGGLIHIHKGGYSAGLFAVQLIAITLAHDTYFYWMHRALHHRRLFRATHLHHHKSRTPTSWAAYSFSAWEGVAEAAFMPIFLLGVSLAGVAYIDFAIFIFLAWMILRNVMGHAGIELQDRKSTRLNSSH